MKHRESILSSREFTSGLRGLATQAELNALAMRMDDRFASVDIRFEQVDKRFEQVDKRFKQVDERFDRIDIRLDRMDDRFAKLEDRLDARFTRIDHTLAALAEAVGRLDARMSTFATKSWVLWLALAMVLGLLGVMWGLIQPAVIQLLRPGAL